MGEAHIWKFSDFLKCEEGVLMELQLLKDLILLVSLILNILLTLFLHPIKYLRERYHGAQERKKKFYEPLIEDLEAIIKDLEGYKEPSRPKGLKDEHLSLLISNKTRLKIKELMKALDELKWAYEDMSINVYPQVLKCNEYGLKEIERRYFIGLSIARPSDSSGLFIEKLREPSALHYFLRCASANEDARLSDFPVFQGLLSNIERAHVNRELEQLLNTILNYLKSSYLFMKVLELRKKCLELSKAVRELLKCDASKLSSKVLGVIHGPGNLQLLSDYVKKREEKPLSILRGA
jgi:hypothetical protein